MTAEQLRRDVRAYLEENRKPRPRECLRDSEGLRFVRPIAELLQSPEILDLLKMKDAEITVISEGPIGWTGHSISSPRRAGYEVRVKEGSLQIYMRGRKDEEYTLPTEMKNWVDAIPYGGYFSWRSDERYEPKTEFVMRSLEEKIRRLLE